MSGGCLLAGIFLIVQVAGKKGVATQSGPFLRTRWCAKLPPVRLVMAIPTPSERVRFGVFEADLRSGELRKHGIKIKLHHQPFQVLAMLLEHPGELVTREELKNKLWPLDTFVDFDVGLNSAVKKLRGALGDSAEIPRYVETLPRRGYRFVGSVSNISTSQVEPTSALLEPVVAEQPSVSNKGMTTEVPPVSAAHSGWKIWATAGVLVALLVLLVGLNARGLRNRLLVRETPVHIRAIAVLPLENLSGDPAQDYFAEGMTDELITDLAQLNELRVISRTSVMRFKGTRTPLPQIARELHVDAIVEGSVVHVDTRVRVSAQLLDATTDRHLWAQTYERDLSDVLGLQRDLAKAIAGEIRIKLSPNESARLESSRAINPLAHAAFLKSRYFTHNQRSSEGALKSVESSLEAVRIAPDWALAYSGLADSYIQAAFLAALPPNEVMPKAKVAARRALELDLDLSEAHVALGWILSDFDYEYSASEREFKRAIELSPSSSYAHQGYADLLNGVGRPDEAISEIKLARQLDPVSFYISRDVGRILYDARRYDEALEALRQAADLNPASGVVYNWMSWAFDKKGMVAQSVEMDLKNEANRGASQEVLQQLREAYRVSGERGYLKKHVELIKDDPYEHALYIARLGETEKALQFLRQACEEHSGWLDMLKVDPELDNLRSDLRFTELLRRIKLSP